MVVVVRQGKAKKGTSRERERDNERERERERVLLLIDSLSLGSVVCGFAMRFLNCHVDS